MDQREILHALIEILVEVGEADPATVTLDSNLVDDLDVDSLLMVELVVAAEERFGVVISDDVVSDLRTVGDVVGHISRSPVSA